MKQSEEWRKHRDHEHHPQHLDGDDERRVGVKRDRCCRHFRDSPGANANMAVVREMPAALAVTAALKIIAMISPTELASATISVFLTPINISLLIFEPIVAPRQICDSTEKPWGHQAVALSPVIEAPAICRTAAPVMLPSSHGAGNRSAFIALHTPNPPSTISAVHAI